MGNLIILRHQTIPPTIGERLRGVGMLIETKLKNNRFNYKELSKVSIVVDKVYTLKKEICILEANNTIYACVLAKVPTSSEILLNQEEALENHKYLEMFKLFEIEFTSPIMPVYGAHIAFQKVSYIPTELEMVYENVFLDKNNVIIN